MEYPTQSAVISNKDKDKVFEQVMDCLVRADEPGLIEIWTEWGIDEQVVLWCLFNSQQRRLMKKLMSLS